jgi:anti-anti-sigma factor
MDTASHPVSAQSPRLLMREVSGLVTLGFPRGVVDGVAVREMLETTALLTDRHNLRMIVDFTGVAMVPSGAMGMLVTIRKKLMHVGGSLHVVVSDPNVKQTFLLTRLDKILCLFDTVDQAAAAFKP